MTTIRQYKKQARVRAAANGTSHQAELNAIAREHGYAAWGSFQSIITQQLASMTAKKYGADRKSEQQRYNMQLIEDPAEELRALIDAYEVAKQAGGHLVVLRPTPEREEAIIELLRKYQEDNPHDTRLNGISFNPFLDREAIVMEEADSNGKTLVAGSGMVERDTNSGQFVVHDPQQRLMKINALYTKRDQEIIYATTAVKYLPPQNNGETVKLTGKTIGKTTIKRSNAPRLVR